MHSPVRSGRDGRFFTSLSGGAAVGLLSWRKAAVSVIIGAAVGGRHGVGAGVVVVVVHVVVVIMRIEAVLVIIRRRIITAIRLISGTVSIAVSSAGRIVIDGGGRTGGLAAENLDLSVGVLELVHDFAKHHFESVDALFLVNDVFGMVLKRGVDVNHVGDYGGVAGFCVTAIGFETAVDFEELADFATLGLDLLAFVGIMLGGLASIGCFPSNILQVFPRVGLKVGMFEL